MYSQRGVYETDFFQPRPKEEVGALTCVFQLGIKIKKMGKIVTLLVTDVKTINRHLIYCKSNWQFFGRTLNLILDFVPTGL